MTELRQRLHGSREDLIVYLAAGWWDGPAGTDRQMASELTRYGPVLYVDPPVSALTKLLKPHHAALSNQPRLQLHHPRMARLITRVIPGMTRPVLRHLRAPMVSRGVVSAVASLCGEGAPVAAVVSSRVDEAWCALPARRRLLYVTDDLVAGADMLGLPRRRLERAERAAVRGADAVAVVSPGLRQRFARDGISAEIVPNGCAPDVFADVDSVAPPEGVPLERPIAGFLGYINDRIDLALLEAVADTGCSLLIVGALGDGFQSPRFATLTARRNVWWAGPRPYPDMPSFMRLIDVGLTPYADTPFNRASFPLKTLEYLSAGRGVVATSLPATRWLDTDLIAIADEPGAFAERVRRALATPRTETLAAQRRAFAERHSWRRRADRMAELLGLTGTITDRTSASSRSVPVPWDG
ncbi:glycosyltransferase [Micromonospora sp. DT47]|uniref:glycosyltransferase n=1 Tax=Micromonospora sp. DT47 TaxID=3393431 RepID=UPI003CF8FE4C